MTTPEQLTELRRLMAEPPTPTGVNFKLYYAAVNALPSLLDAAEREAKLREALEEIAECENAYAHGLARAALVEGGAA